MIEIIIAVLGGSALSALITQVGSYISDRHKRKDIVEDRTEDKDAALKQGIKLLLADKIQYLGLRYIEEGEVTFSNKKMLNEMHSVYHNGLGGNGDYDGLMKEVNELPLKG
nr:MAG TPA: holin protein [Caudoviricetes sp.]